eukprot:TRINITY_DN15080_c0_g2_i3.p1 TRINITY_DN15080_c0_g2~~TRINITY_DN15080_c0_g2_i3.p1  ORF type:complete len:270 (+),score=68.92 TRINITY_DN15080_c0_g2_i3:75-884(+)
MLATSFVALAVGCFPQCGDSCELMSPPGHGTETRLNKLKQACTAGEEVVFSVDYNPCTHNLEYEVNTPNRCEQRQGNVFTCKKNKKCKVTPILTELIHCDCSKCDNHHCDSHQQCTLQEVQCVQAPCEKQPTCVDRPCDLQCGEGEECQWQEVQCVTTPCDPVKTCVPTRQEPANPCGKCGELEVCYMQDVTCFAPPCDPVPTCVRDICASVRCPDGTDCLLTNNGASAECKPWADITCADKPCDAGYNCQDVRRVCVKAPCYQFDCSL